MMQPTPVTPENHESIAPTTATGIARSIAANIRELELQQAKLAEIVLRTGKAIASLKETEAAILEHFTEPPETTHVESAG